MAYILNIETATTNCSVSVSEHGKTIALKEDNGLNFSHAERLHLYIDEALNDANIKASDLHAIAVSKGPGSYTGLRIGVSSAKGLCFSLGIPLISVPTLQSLAHQVKTKEGVIIPMLDARRMEVYSCVFDANFSTIRETQAEILQDHSFKKYLDNNKVYFIGTGVAKTKDVIAHTNAFFIESKLPSANEMSTLAYTKYIKSDTEDVAYFEPYYLKDFVAFKKKVKY